MMVCLLKSLSKLVCYFIDEVLAQHSKELVSLFGEHALDIVFQVKISHPSVLMIKHIGHF